MCRRAVAELRNVKRAEKRNPRRRYPLLKMKCWFCNGGDGFDLERISAERRRSRVPVVV